MLVAFRAVMLAFFLLLRASEFLGSTKAGRCSEWVLQLQGVQLLQAGSAVPLQRADWGRATQARLLLRGSKTDQRQRGKTLVLAATDGSAVNPIVVLRALLQALPAGVDGSSPLMTLFRGQQQSVLTRAELAAVVQQMVSDAGRDIDNIGTHAMRVGGATTLQ